MEMWRVVRQYDDTARWIRLQLLGRELLTDANLKDARHYGVDPIFRMPVRHELYSVRDLHAHDVGRG